MSNAKVELFDVALKGCNSFALNLSNSTSETTLVATRCEFANSIYGALVYGSLNSATFNNCVFNDNIRGLVVNSTSTIHLHGEATAIHSNGDDGISAWNGSQVIIHLPSDHNTSYNNTRDDRRTGSGGTITNVGIVD